MGYVRSAFVCLRAFVVFGAVGLAAVAHASKLPDFYRAGVNTSGNSAKIGMTSESTAWGSTIPISPTIGGWSQAGNYGIPAAAKGTTMNMNASGDVFFSGTKYPFQAGYTVPASNVFAGLKTAAEFAGGALGGPIGLALIVGSLSAPYIKQWFDESDLRVKPDGSGIQKGDPNYCATNCYRWRGNIYIPWQATPTLACQAWVAVNANRSFISVQPVQESAGRWSCTSRYGNEPNTMTFELVRESRAPDVAKSWFDIPSLSDISPYMTPRPFDPRVIPEILDRRGDIPMPSPTITGPSSLPGPSTTTKNPDGSTTVVNTTSNFTISGDTITNISNISSTTIYNSSSVVMSTSTSTVTPAPTKAEEQKTDCDKYPDSIGCSKYGTPVASDTLGRESRNVSITSATFAGGSCPGPVSFSVFSHSYEFSYSTLCDKLAMIAPLLLGLSALLAAYIFADGFRA